GKPALAGYPPTFRSFLGLLAMRAAIDAKALDAAQSYQAIVAASHPEQDEAAMLEALSGLLLTKSENPDAARPHLLAAVRSTPSSSSTTAGRATDCSSISWSS